jgi:hypothetical protein
MPLRRQRQTLHCHRRVADIAAQALELRALIRLRRHRGMQRKTERSVRTASSEQVRQPIFREGLDQWKHYEPWLGQLNDALGDALVRYRQ